MNSRTATRAARTASTAPVAAGEGLRVVVAAVLVITIVLLLPLAGAGST